VITSEGSNSLKRIKEIFEYALRKTGAEKRSIMLEIVEVDIQGAIKRDRSGIYQSPGPAPSIQPTYMVRSLERAGRNLLTRRLGRVGFRSRLAPLLCCTPCRTALGRLGFFPFLLALISAGMGKLTPETSKRGGGKHD